MYENINQQTEKTPPVQYEGEFVLTRDGNKDFGEITPEIAIKIRRQAGKIRLRIGEQNGRPGDYGEKHIERKERMQELRSNGFTGMISRSTYLKNKKPLWEKPQSG